MQTSPLIIAGAGIAGLASALALERREAIILEKAAAFSPIGAGLQLGPNAVRALRKLGAWDTVEPVTSSPPEIHLRDGVTGKILKRLKLGAAFERRYGAPYRVAHRADLHTALLRRVQQNNNIEIRLGSAITGLEVNSLDVAVGTSQKTFSTQALLAGDGVHSTVRQQLFSNTAAINSGEVHHRALIAIPPDGGLPLECVTLWMYPHGHVVHYPAGADQRLNIVAITPQNVKPETHFREAAASLQTLLVAAGNDFTPWPGFYVPPLLEWTRGGVFLLGDAAHGTLPYLAQGAAMAFEDAACLSQVLPTTHSLRHAFAETAQRRRLRTSRLHTESVKAGRTYHLQGAMRLARNTVLRGLPTEVLARQLSWIYRG